jgi:hypothetical protein
MKDPEEKEMMAYIAGLIDGDGHIGIRIGPRGKICPLIQVHNSVKQMPAFIHKLFGGTLASDKPKKEGYRTIWKFMLQGEEGCKNLIEKVGQYLVLKQDSAKEVLEFIQNPVAGKDYYKKCKDLNHKRKIQDVSFENIQRQNNEDPYFWAYIAGLMDTDGSFSIERAVRKPAEGNRQKKNLIKYRPKILLSMVTEKSIRHLLENCPFGSVCTINAKTALRGSAFRFSIQSRPEAIEFLKKIIPYLQAKSIQAIILLNFCRNYMPTNGLAKVPEEELQYREDCYKEIVRLNNMPSLLV